MWTFARRAALATGLLIVVATTIATPATSAPRATPAPHAASAPATPHATAAPADVPAAPPGFTTTWSDDFNGAAGSALDTGAWRYDTGNRLRHR